jgi:catechol 2,3-dioxygenase-like lactoylglutathione lyase family enzyme
MAATQVWIKQFGGPLTDSAGGISTDSDGNVYLTGDTEDSLGGPNAGAADVYLAKYDSSGNRLWIRQLGSSARDSARGVSPDNQGNVYIAGYTSGSLAGPNAGDYDAFLAKYDNAGNHLWTRQLGTASGEYATVSADSGGNVYIAGDTHGSLAGPNAGDADAYLAKYDPNGNRLWLKQFGSSAGDAAAGISTDKSGNVYIAGPTDGNVGGTNVGAGDTFIAKYDPAGNRLWIRQLGGPAVDYATGISTDSSGNAYIAGITNGSLDGTNTGGYDVFLARYDPAGNHVWTRQLGSSADDFAKGVSTASLGNAYIAGATAGNLNGTNAGDVDAFLAKYDANGNHLWVKQLGSSSLDAASSITTDGSGSVSVAGETRGSLGGPNAGEVDAFLAKYH